jgi:hypothetical protein
MTHDQWPGDALEAFEFLDGAEAARGGERGDDLVFAALIVGRRTETPGRRGFEINALDVAVERQVEIEPGLFAIRDDVEAGGQLVMLGGVV